MGNTSARVKRAFEALDPDGRGYVTLRDLFHAHKLRGWEWDPLPRSSMLLFHFNAPSNYNGRFSLDEFSRIVDFVQHLRKETGNSGGLLGSLFSGMSYLGKGSFSSFQGHNGTGGKRRLTAYANPALRTGSQDDHASSDIVRSEAEEILYDLLGNISWRSTYKEWLYRSADLHDDGIIAPDALNVILQSIVADGVNPEVFSFSKESEDVPLAVRLVSEYDTMRVRGLCRNDFLILAELILKEYESTYRHMLIRTNFVGDYVLTRTLGTGAVGVVKLGLHRTTGVRKAIKIIAKGRVSEMTRLDNEIEAMKVLNHPHIVALDDVFEDDENVYLVMELCGGGSLVDFMMTTFHNNEAVARYAFEQVLDGLEYCHSKGVAHRDLRLENLLLDNEGNVKISDFGHAVMFKRGWDFFSTALVGSIFHLSPEQLSGKVYAGEDIDIWGCGIMLYRLVHGAPPFRNGPDFCEDILNSRFEFPPEFSPELRDFISKILVCDPKQRLPVAAMRRHPWLTKGAKERPILFAHELRLDPSLYERRGEFFELMCEIVRARDSLTVHVARPFDSSLVRPVNPTRKDAVLRSNSQSRLDRFGLPARGMLSEGETGHLPSATSARSSSSHSRTASPTTSSIGGEFLPGAAVDGDDLPTANPKDRSIEMPQRRQLSLPVLPSFRSDRARSVFHEAAECPDMHLRLSRANSPVAPASPRVEGDEKEGTDHVHSRRGRASVAHVSSHARRDHSRSRSPPRVSEVRASHSRHPSRDRSPEREVRASHSRHPSRDRSPEREGHVSHSRHRSRDHSRSRSPPRVSEVRASHSRHPSRDRSPERKGHVSHSRTRPRSRSPPLLLDVHVPHAGHSFREYERHERDRSRSRSPPSRAFEVHHYRSRHRSRSHSPDARYNARLRHRSRSRSPPQASGTDSHVNNRFERHHVSRSRDLHRSHVASKATRSHHHHRSRTSSTTASRDRRGSPTARQGAQVYRSSSPPPWEHRPPDPLYLQPRVPHAPLSPKLEDEDVSAAEKFENHPIIYCFHSQRKLKFSISMSTVADPKSDEKCSRFLFELREGDTQLFLKIARRLAGLFRERVGIDSSNDETIKRLAVLSVSDPSTVSQSVDTVFSDMSESMDVPTRGVTVIAEPLTPLPTALLTAAMASAQEDGLPVPVQRVGELPVVRARSPAPRSDAA